MRIYIVAMLGLLLWAAAPVLAQATQKTNTVPPFKILQTNGRYFAAGDLDKNRPVVLIYFAPDCSHCQTLMDGVFKNITAFKNTQLVLVTFKPASELELFERQYNTPRYPNIKTGTEGTTFFLRNHYKMTQTPFTAVFNKGTMVCSFRNINTPVTDIINCVKKLN